MSYKNNNETTFSDLAILNSLEQNRTYEFLNKLNQVINWSKVEKILKQNYTIGENERGQKAFNPLVLFKCLLLQKWFGIISDPELESQINDRISFRKFIGFSMEDISPDHSTFSRFRQRLSKETMDKINNEILNQFHQKGISINKGVAVDARLIESASKPISNEDIKKLKEAKKEKEPKFSRDLESTWAKKNEKLHYGIKEHVAVDTTNGFVLSMTLSTASEHDYKYLPYCVATSKHTDEHIEGAYADKGYSGKSNRMFLSINKIKDFIMRKDTKNSKLTQYEKERNKSIAKIRYIVEQYFGITHLKNFAKKARFTTIIKNLMDASYRQISFNLQRALKVLPAY